MLLNEAGGRFRRNETRRKKHDIMRCGVYQRLSLLSDGEPETGQNGNLRCGRKNGARNSEGEMRAKETERGAAKDSRHTGQQRRSEKIHENLMNQKSISFCARPNDQEEKNETRYYGEKSTI
jgi:hypothetical protein